MRKYKHIFFDLDRTLWDFDKNSSLTLLEIIEHFDLTNKVKDKDNFCQTYHKYNEYVWGLYRNNQIKKKELRKERFRLLFADFNLYDPKLIESVDDYYVKNSPKKPITIDSAEEVLQYLDARYCLSIISNGFQEVQELKLISSKLRHYFRFIFTSDKIGAAKPGKQFFEYTIKSANARKTESLVIGDDIHKDIVGAKNFNVDQVWFNPSGKTAHIKPTFEIHHLKEIMEIL